MNKIIKLIFILILPFFVVPVYSGDLPKGWTKRGDSLVCVAFGRTAITALSVENDVWTTQMIHVGAMPGMVKSRKLPNGKFEHDFTLPDESKHRYQVALRDGRCVVSVFDENKTLVRVFSFSENDNLCSVES